MTEIKKRLASLDIFRGLTVAAMILVNTPGDWNQIYAPLEHSKWNGCTPTDVVFPAFLFIVGVSIVYALQKKRERHELHKAIILHGLRRMVLLILFGLGIFLFYRPSFSTLRYLGVLQRIGVVYFIAMLCYLKLSRRVLSFIIIFCLLGYYLALTLIPLPGGLLPNLEPATNLGAFIDRFVFGIHHLYPYTKTWDPVGLLSTIPSIATTLLGIKVGEVLKDQKTNEFSKIQKLLLSGVLAVIAGIIWGLFFPINKSLWTSSYVLYTAGICTIMLTLIYWCVDVCNKGKAIFWPFLVFGMNALSAYILSEILPGVIDFIRIPVKNGTISGMKWLYSQVFVQYFTEKTASLLSAICFVLLMWLIMLVFYKKKIVIKV